MRILVVDDDEQVRNAIARLLRGHTVVMADTAASALAHLGDRATTFDAVLCDLWMPGMDGRAFYGALAEVRSDMLARVAFITGDLGTTRMKDFLADVRRPALEKPFTRAELLATLDAIRGAPPASGVHATTSEATKTA